MKLSFIKLLSVSRQHSILAVDARIFLSHLALDVWLAEVDRRLLRSIKYFRVGAVVEEEKSYFRLLVLQGQVQRRVAFAVLSVHIGTVLNEYLGDGRSTEGGSPMKSSVKSIINHGDVCSMLNQELEDVFVAFRSCVLQTRMTSLLLVINVGSFRHQQLD